MQDIECKPKNTKYRLGVHRLPDGSLNIANLPKGVSPRFGINIKAHKSDLFRLKRCDGMKFDNESDWFNFLKNQSIDSDEHIKTATEGALIGFLSTSGLLNHLVLDQPETPLTNNLFEAVRGCDFRLKSLKIAK